mmetsp:Transcript_14521/g.37651  ORF Transcript_14521/g.37651 Transcript_14521/m.37651 type:complete len:120 (+) Transcript_14521:1038-1397(+)
MVSTRGNSPAEQHHRQLQAEATNGSTFAGQILDMDRFHLINISLPRSALSRRPVAHATPVKPSRGAARASRPRGEKCALAWAGACTRSLSKVRGRTRQCAPRFGALLVASQGSQFVEGC